MTRIDFEIAGDGTVDRLHPLTRAPEPRSATARLGRLARVKKASTS